MKKYLTAREAYVDFLTGDLTECPLDPKGRLLEQYDGNDYSKSSNDCPDWDEDSEDEDCECNEIFDPDYHKDYFDVDDVDEYAEDDGENEYMEDDLWDEEDFNDEDEFDE